MKFDTNDRMTAFRLLNPFPLDSRTYVTSIEELKTLMNDPTVYDGLQVTLYNESDTSGNGNFVHGTIFSYEKGTPGNKIARFYSHSGTYKESIEEKYTANGFFAEAGSSVSFEVNTTSQRIITSEKEISVSVGNDKVVFIDLEKSPNLDIINVTINNEFSYLVLDGSIGDRNLNFIFKKTDSISVSLKCYICNLNSGSGNSSTMAFYAYSNDPWFFGTLEFCGEDAVESANLKSKVKYFSDICIADSAIIYTDNDLNLHIDSF